MPPKIKVLHMITRLDTGGSSTNTIETVSRLDKRKYEVILLAGKTFDPDGSIAGTLRAKKVSFYFEDSLVRNVHPLKDIQAMWRLILFIRREKCDIVHTHSSKAGILGRWAAKLCGVKIIVHTPHGHIFYGYFNKCVTLVFLWTERLTALWTDKIITLTRQGTSDHVALRVAPADKFTTIYSGIDLPIIDEYQKGRQTQRLHHKIDFQDFVFGFLGRLETIKDVATLVASFAHLAQKHLNVKLLLVGDGEEKENLIKQIRQLHIDRHVIFAGHQKEIYKYLCMMDVFVLPSLNEGMGRAALEAMHAGLPVIASRVGGLPEIISHEQDGLLFTPKDTAALTQCMNRTFEDKEFFQKLKTAARQKVGKNFSLQKMVADIDKLYGDLLKQKLL